MHLLQKLTPSLFLLAAIVVSSGLAVAGALLIAGGTTTSAPEVPRAATVSHSTRASAARKAPVPGREPTRPALASHTFLIAATRGDCWLTARNESATGPVLSEGLLVQGRSLRLTGTSVWLSLGAAGNVDVTIDGEPLPISLSGTVETVLPAQGEP